MRRPWAWACTAIRVSTDPTISAITSVPWSASSERVMLDRNSAAALAGE